MKVKYDCRPSCSKFLLFVETMHNVFSVQFWESDQLFSVCSGVKALQETPISLCSYTLFLSFQNSKLSPKLLCVSFVYSLELKITSILIQMFIFWFSLRQHCDKGSSVWCNGFVIQDPMTNISIFSLYVKIFQTVVKCYIINQLYITLRGWKSFEASEIYC